MNYSDETKPNIPNRQEQLPVSFPKRKGSKKNGGNSVSQNKDPVPCQKHVGGLWNASSNTANKEACGSNHFQGSNFMHTIDPSIFPQKNVDEDEEDNKNDDESSGPDPETSVIEDFEEDKSASPEEPFPLASQCSPSFAILSGPPVQ